MITLQHSLITLFANNGNEEELSKEIPYILLPDAIRKYTGLRQYSHFEINPSNGDTSWIKYPTNLKELNDETVEKLPKYLATKLTKCVLGEKTEINVFQKYNKHLPKDEYFGIKKHLIQDQIFDKWIREEIDCSRRNENVFLFQCKEFQGTDIRKLITDIEYQGLYILAYMNYQTYGITTNQEWFNKYVKEQLDLAYPKDLVDRTYQYMRIPDYINEKISKHDWSELKQGYVSLESYIDMYKSVASEMIKIDMQKQNESKNDELEKDK